jgi:Protein involved in initiation of plasmid replication
MKKPEFDNIEASRGYHVVKNNELIQKARYDLSMQEQKIILYLISKVKPDDEDFKLYEFQIKDFCEVCGIDESNGGNYVMLKDTIKKLMDKSNWVTIIKDGEEAETILRWVEKAYLYKKSGIIKIRLDNDMKPYLLNLKKQFTKYSLYFTLAMKSKYSLRIYELLKSYQNLEKCEFEIEKLKLMLTAEKYASFADFKIKVLDIAVREINTYSDISVSYELEKQGRKYHKIKFKIIQKYNQDFEETMKLWKNINEKLNR